MSKIVTYITDELLAPDLCFRLKKEGCDLYLAQKEKSDILTGVIKKIPYGERFLYAKKSDLIIYDGRSEGEASRLRAKGKSVIGGGEKADKIEIDRMTANKVAEQCGMLVPKVQEIKDLGEAKKFLKKTKGRWVMKQQGKLDSVKGLNFVSKMENSEDLIDYIDWLKERWSNKIKQDFILQEYIDGHEVGCGAWWNGDDFMRDKDGDVVAETNWEHKPLMPGNMGESTGEMYTVFCQHKAGELYKETLEKVIPLIKKTDYRGDFDINCKVNEKGVYFLEFTNRIGVPIISGQISVMKTPWFEFLKAVADGNQIDFKYDDRFCIVSWLLTKPFPFMASGKVKELAKSVIVPDNEEHISELMNFELSDSFGIPIILKDLNKNELNEVHWDGVMYKNGKLQIGNSDGYVVTVTGKGRTVDEAGKKVEDIMEKIIVPKKFYRNDFYDSNYHKSVKDLTKWGYL